MTHKSFFSDPENVLTNSRWLALTPSDERTQSTHLHGGLALTLKSLLRAPSENRVLLDSVDHDRVGGQKVAGDLAVPTNPVNELDLRVAEWEQTSERALDAGYHFRYMALRAAVTAFRRSVERYARSSPHSPLHGFPNGCCKTVSLLLSRYLAEQGFGEAELVANGKRGLVPHLETHAWLRLGDQTIDITADQFGPEHAPVIVGAATSLHATFREVTVHAYNTYLTFNAVYQARHDIMYTGITALMDAAERAGSETQS